MQLPDRSNHCRSMAMSSLGVGARIMESVKKRKPSNLNRNRLRQINSCPVMQISFAGCDECLDQGVSYLNKIGTLRNFYDDTICSAAIARSRELKMEVTIVAFDFHTP